MWHRHRLERRRSGTPAARASPSARPARELDEQPAANASPAPAASSVVLPATAELARSTLPIAHGDRTAGAEGDAGEAASAGEQLHRLLRTGSPVSRRAAASFASTTDASSRNRRQAGGVERDPRCAVARASAAATVASGRCPETSTTSASSRGRCSGSKRALAPRSARISPSTTRTVPVGALGIDRRSRPARRAAASSASSSRPAASSPTRPATDGVGAELRRPGEPHSAPSRPAAIAIRARVALCPRR